MGLPMDQACRQPAAVGLTQLAGREPYIWRVIGQNTPYMAVGMTQSGPNCVTPTLDQPYDLELISKLRCPVVVYSISGQPAWEGKTDGVSGANG
jgi:hypothetical protein